MHTPSFIKQILFVISILFFVSCDQEYNEIGADLLNQNNFETSTHISNVIAYNEEIGPVQSNNLPVNALGVFTNPAFGQTIASFATQVQLASVNPTINPLLNQEIESVVLSIPYFVDSAETETKDGGGFTYKLDSIYGNETKPAFKLSVYESGIYMYLDAEDNLLSSKKYYTNQNADFDSYKIGNRLNDSIAVSQNESFFFDKAQHLDKVTDSDGKVTDTTYSAPGMRLKLNKDFFRDKILKAPAGKLVNNTVFAEYFRGLYFKVEKIEGQDGRLAMMDFSKGTITINYKEDKFTTTNGETTQTRVDKSIILNLSGNRVSLLEDSNRNAAYSNALTNPNKTDGDARLFLKGGQGALTVIKLFQEPGELETLRENDWLINEANLVFYIDTENADFKKSPEPQRIYLYDLTNNTPIADYSISNSKKGSVQYDGRLILDDDETNPRGKYYKIRITNHIKSLIKNKTSNNVSLGVVVTEDINNFSSYKLFNQSKDIKEVPVASVMNPLGTILYGSNSENADKKLKLEIKYTNPN
ncbi:MAG: DUF4270 domain-containing protein [Flavobacterium sp.]|nr:DUF4270 domain-containing protein [Flavobacterium sp.]